MGPGEHRPFDEQYWTRPWSTALFAGDLFEGVPSGEQPTIIYTAEDAPPRHFLGEIVFGYGLLITPTCDMTDQLMDRVAHPYRTIVPVLPLELVLRETGALAESANLLRSRDAIRPYMYMPPLAGVIDEEAVACLFRPALVSDALLSEPPRRVAQLQPEARRHLKVKLAAYWSRVAIDPTELPLTERGEKELRARAWPPSRYDDPARPAVDR